MNDQWWHKWIGPSILLLAVGVLFSILPHSWEFVLIKAGGLGAMIWYEWDCRRKET